MSSPYEYDDDPVLEQAPLTPDDVEWLLDGVPKNLRKDKGALEHLIGRAVATARELRAARMSFDAELRRREAQVVMSAAPVAGTLSPEAAARFLSPEQLTNLFDAFSRQRLEILEGQRAAAQQEAQNWRDIRGTVVAALEQILTHDLDADTRREIADLHDWVAARPMTIDPDDRRTGVEGI